MTANDCQSCCTFLLQQITTHFNAINFPSQGNVSSVAPLITIGDEDHTFLLAALPNSAARGRKLLSTGWAQRGLLQVDPFDGMRRGHSTNVVVAVIQITCV